MAQTNTCDLCGQPAISIVAISSTTTTTVTLDVCEEHHALFKKLVRQFTGKDAKVSPLLKASAACALGCLREAEEGHACDRDVDGFYECELNNDTEIRQLNKEAGSG